MPAEHRLTAPGAAALFGKHPGHGDFIAAGLDGLEVDHRDNPPQEREAMRRLAHEHGLIVTGSSDYHGTGKPNRLGEHVTSDHMLAKLLERASSRPGGVDYIQG